MFLHDRLWIDMSKFFQIRETLTPCELEDISDRKVPYVAFVSREEFESLSNVFDLGIDLDLQFEHIGITKIQVNYDSLTGRFAIPDPANGVQHIFFFAIDEKGMIFIDDDGTAAGIVDMIIASKKWKAPCLERFIYDFLEGIVRDDLIELEKYEKRLDELEDRAVDGDLEDIMEELVDIRSDIQEYRTHYEQLIDLGQELEENENNFFASKKLRFFRLFIERVGRLQNLVSNLREHTLMIRDLYHSKMDEKQNRNMAYLTVIATIFTPLTLITGWFGMNFKYMPELDEPWAYPAVIGACLLIVGIIIFIFKKKKWL